MPECSAVAVNGLFCQQHWDAVAGSTKRLMREAIATAITDVHLANKHLPNPDAFYRASHLTRCKTCGRKYIDHPTSVEAPFLHVLCGGDFVKL